MKRFQNFSLCAQNELIPKRSSKVYDQAIKLDIPNEAKDVKYPSIKNSFVKDFHKIKLKADPIDPEREREMRVHDEMDILKINILKKGTTKHLS